MSQTSARVLMIGPGEVMPGGMSAVVQTYRLVGLFSHANVRYISSYEGAGATRQLVTFGAVAGRLVLELLRGRVDILHVHSAARGSFWRKSLLSALARGFGCPYIFHIHSGEFPHFYEQECGAISKRWTRSTLMRAAQVLVLTPSWQRSFEAIIPGLRLRLAPNPVEVPALPPTPRSRGRTILFLGRIREKKGVFDLLEAMPAVRALCPEVRLVLAGDGELERAKARARQLGIADAVELVGWIDGDEKRRALLSADVFVLPSYFEGLPIGILEAMALQIPVVASRVGGIPDLVEPGVSGLLHEPGDVAGLAAQLVAALTDIGLRQRLVQGGRSAVAMHEARKVVRDLLELYEAVATQDATRGTGK